MGFAQANNPASSDYLVAGRNSLRMNARRSMIRSLLGEGMQRLSQNPKGSRSDIMG